MFFKYCFTLLAILVINSSLCVYADQLPPVVDKDISVTEQSTIVKQEKQNKVAESLIKEEKAIVKEKTKTRKVIPFEQLIIRMLMALCIALGLIGVISLIVYFFKKSKGQKEIKSDKNIEKINRSANEPENISQAVSSFVKHKL